MESLATQLAELYNIFSASLDSLGIDLEHLREMLVYDSRQPMLFNTGMFLVLFAGFMLVYRMLRPWRVARMLFTILFSLYFYYKTSGDCYLILIGVAVSDYVLGLGMQRARSMEERYRPVVMRLIAL